MDYNSALMYYSFLQIWRLGMEAELKLVFSPPVILSFFSSSLIFAGVAQAVRSTGLLLCRLIKG